MSILDIITYQNVQMRYIAIDEKKARRSFTTKDRNSALHTVSAWSCQHQLVLGQTAVNQKTDEVTAIRVRLTMLDVEK
jgi:hypothetical protein